MRSVVRFRSWIGFFPLLLVVVFGLISFGFSFGPSPLFKSHYPLDYEDRIAFSSRAHGVDPYLVAAIISSESSWQPDVVSHRGAVGLMQLMPETASDMARKGLVDVSRYDADDLEDPAVNIEYGCAYLAYLLHYFNGATDRAIAAYNAGMGNVDAWVRRDERIGGAIAFPATQAYLVRVLVAQNRYRELYPDAFS